MTEQSVFTQIPNKLADKVVTFSRDICYQDFQMRFSSEITHRNSVSEMGSCKSHAKFTMQNHYTVTSQITEHYYKEKLLSPNSFAQKVTIFFFLLLMTYLQICFLHCPRGIIRNPYKAQWRFLAVSGSKSKTCIVVREAHVEVMKTPRSLWDRKTSRGLYRIRAAFSDKENREDKKKNPH